MTVDDSRAALHRAVRDLWNAVAELVLSTNDDQPEQSDLAAAGLDAHADPRSEHRPR